MKKVLAIFVFFLWSKWSLFYRFVFEGKYSKREVSKYPTIEYLGITLKQIPWVKERFFDTCISPERFQYSVDICRAPWIGRDCDDFSAYAYKCCQQIDNIEPLFCMSVNYRDGWKIGGHSVCVVQNMLTNEIYHLSNWGLVDVISLSGLTTNDVSIDDEFVVKVIANSVVGPLNKEVFAITLYDPISMKRLKTYC